MKRYYCLEKVEDGTWSIAELNEEGYEAINSDDYDDSGWWDEWEEFTIDELIERLKTL